jgi:HNH endonuclease
MRHLTRLPKPAILVQKETEWTAAFVASDKARPDNSKYGHTQIRECLHNMSFHKCFYCETKLKDAPQQIDHFIEVAERRDLAFAWDNLYSACTNCNLGRPDNRSIPVTTILNPCLESDEEIEKHLMFEDEMITAKVGTQKGLDTIQKFKLDTPLLDRLRSRRLHEFKNVLLQIQRNQNNQARRTMTEDELDALYLFAQPDQSFSLLFRLLLKKYSIHS